jgi:hypothetical protein
MHEPIPLQGKWLQQIVSGYFNYHAVPTNSRALHGFRHSVAELWQRSLRRRSQRDGMSWERFTQLANDWLPKPRILPYGSVRGGRSVMGVSTAIRARQLIQDLIANFSAFSLTAILTKAHT